MSAAERSLPSSPVSMFTHFFEGWLAFFEWEQEREAETVRVYKRMLVWMCVRETATEREKRERERERETRNINSAIRFSHSLQSLGAEKKKNCEENFLKSFFNYTDRRRITDDGQAGFVK